MDNFSSEFIHSRAWFGKYPDASELEILVNSGITDIIDLTTTTDNLPAYQFNGYIWKYPINDHRTPDDLKQFEAFIDQIIYLIFTEPTRKIYVHCKGGHGRAGLFVASLLKRNYLNTNPSSSNQEATTYALNLTYQLHQQRKVMKPQWRRRGSPQTKAQKDFVGNIFL